jgi:hypothetical protein
MLSTSIQLNRTSPCSSFPYETTHKCRSISPDPDGTTSGTEAAATAAPAADPAGQCEKRYFEIRVSELEIGEDREDRHKREAEEAQRLAFRPVLQDIACAVRPVVKDMSREAERALEARLAAHSEAAQRAADRRFRGLEGRLAALASALTLSTRQRHAPGPAGLGRRERGGAASGGRDGVIAHAGGGIGGADGGAENLLPRRGGKLLALPKRN